MMVRYMHPDMAPEHYKAGLRKGGASRGFAAGCLVIGALGALNQ